MIPPRYAKKSPHQLLLMGYGAFSLWAIIKPERFGFQPIPKSAISAAAVAASKELGRMFHNKPLKPWKARDNKRGLEIMKLARRQLMEAPIAIETEP